MKILGIETSCDDTAVAIVKVRSEKRKVGSIEVLSNVISSQVKLHAKYGGVVPNLAAREHTKNIGHVFELALKEARIKNFSKEIDLIAVTRGPGLGPSLLVGIAFARTLAWKYDKPLVGVSHLEGHVYSNWLQPVAVSSKSQISNPKQTQNSIRQLADKIQNIFPALNLIVSGGHTELVLMDNHGKYKIIGETLDDAVGEAFDKVARLLGLGYPGGPQIARHAEQFTRNYTELTQINAENISVNPRTNQRESTLGEFPRPMINSKNYNFSYAGLKTSVLYKVRDLESAGVKLTNSVINQICYEFQKAALDVLVFKTIRAAQEYNIKSLFLSGGVSANKELREQLREKGKELGVNYFQPELEYTTDNAAMIAAAGYFKYTKGKEKPQDLTWDKVEMDANLGF